MVIGNWNIPDVVVGASVTAISAVLALSGVFLKSLLDSREAARTREHGAREAERGRDHSAREAERGREHGAQESERRREYEAREAERNRQVQLRREVYLAATSDLVAFMVGLSRYTSPDFDEQKFFEKLELMSRAMTRMQLAGSPETIVACGKLQRGFASATFHVQRKRIVLMSLRGRMDAMDPNTQQQALDELRSRLRREHMQLARDSGEIIKSLNPVVPELLHEVRTELGLSGAADVLMEQQEKTLLLTMAEMERTLQELDQLE